LSPAAGPGSPPPARVGSVVTLSGTLCVRVGSPVAEIGFRPLFLARIGSVVTLSGTHCVQVFLFASLFRAGGSLPADRKCSLLSGLSSRDFGTDLDGMSSLRWDRFEWGVFVARFVAFSAYFGTDGTTYVIPGLGSSPSLRSRPASRRSAARATSQRFRGRGASRPTSRRFGGSANLSKLGGVRRACRLGQPLGVLRLGQPLEVLWRSSGVFRRRRRVPRSSLARGSEVSLPSVEHTAGFKVFLSIFW
jgi:hypothetical protein